MTQVLVTGANGFIGSHLVEEFLGKGYDVTILVRPDSDKGYDHRDIKTILGDITDRRTFARAGTYDVVYHLAALTEFAKFHADIAYGIKVNVEGTRNVIEGLKDKMKRFVYVSTLAVYGNTLDHPQTEESQPMPVEEYAESKLAAEKVTIELCIKYHIPSVVARVFSCYGGRQKPTFFIPSIISQALTSDTITMGNSEATRDFIHVKDVVNALHTLGAKDCQGIYNIGTVIETKTGEVVKMIVAIAGGHHTIEKKEGKYKEQALDVSRSRADITKISALGWTPKILLRDGLSETYRWCEHEHAGRNREDS